MRNRLVQAVALVILALAAVTPAAPTPPASVSAAQENAPAPAEALRQSAEALRHLEKSLTRHGSYAANGFVRRFDARDFRGCRITYDLTPLTPPGHTGFVPFTERTTVDLASLDAARVQVRVGRRGATVSFAAGEGASAIERRLGEGPLSFGDASPQRSAYLYVSSKGAAEDVRAALVRAIESCGKL